MSSYRRNKIWKEERASFNAWLNQSPQNKLFYDKIRCSTLLYALPEGNAEEQLAFWKSEQEAFAAIPGLRPLPDLDIAKKLAAFDGDFSDPRLSSSIVRTPLHE